MVNRPGDRANDQTATDIGIMFTVINHDPSSRGRPQRTHHRRNAIMTVDNAAIHGFNTPGFEAVRDTFAKQAYLMGDGGAAFAATRDGELVVDLWTGMADRDRPWSRTTRVHIQSTSKAVTAATAMMLVDRGELDLDAKVSRYWPEYGCNGKENTTVETVYKCLQ
jgi:CubicO group peptidase (beta-lactamase class C family)